MQVETTLRLLEISLIINGLTKAYGLLLTKIELILHPIKKKNNKFIYFSLVN